MVEICMDRVSQHGVAEHTRGHGLQIPVALFADAMRCFVEEKKLVFEGRVDPEAHGLRLVDRARKNRTRADVRMLADEAADQKERVLFKGDASE